MSPQAGRPQLQSLAARLAALGPGSPCPWCGARLKAQTMEGRLVSVTPTTGDSQIGGAVLVCAECGCEVAPVEETAESGCRLLHHAA
jgi:hypothetical protein